MRFVDEIVCSLPNRMTLPSALSDLLNWMEDNGYVANIKATNARYADVYPVDSPIWTPMGFRAVDGDHVACWNRDNDLSARLAPIFRTGGDGSYAALWLDDEGKTRVVHMGSGSGSTYAGIMTDNVIDFIRLIAIGYQELCWPEIYTKTPKQVHKENDYEDVEYVPPKALQSWVKERFKVTIPKTASQIIKHTTDMDDRTSDDAFWMYYRGYSKQDVVNLGAPPQSLIEAYERILPSGMVLPDELKALFNWFAANGYSDSGKKGDDWRASLITRNVTSSPDYFFFANNEFVKSFPKLAAGNCVLPLCYTLRGDSIGVWLDGEVYKTVHISKDAKGFTGVLTHSIKDFICLISMGYDSLSDPKLFKKSPEELYVASFKSFMSKKELADFLKEEPFRTDERLQAWVKKTFSIAIPQVGSDIVACADRGKRTFSADVFVKYMESL